MSNRTNYGSATTPNTSNMNPGFIRIKLLELDPPPTKIVSLLDPFCAVNIKELIKTSNQIIQRKPTFYPKWYSKVYSKIYKSFSPIFL